MDAAFNRNIHISGKIRQEIITVMVITINNAMLNMINNNRYFYVWGKFSCFIIPNPNLDRF